MNDSDDSISEFFGSVIGGIIGFAIFVWMAWCVVIGFIGGTFPLTEIQTEGSIGGGIAAMFVVTFVAGIVATILTWAVALVFGMASGTAWLGARVFRLGKPFAKWSDNELRGCIKRVYVTDPDEDSASPKSVAIVFHQDPAKLPKRVIENTVARFGEFSPYVTIEISDPGDWQGHKAGWSSHSEFGIALAAAQEVVGPGAVEVTADDPAVREFEQTLFSVIRRPWEWD